MRMHTYCRRCRTEMEMNYEKYDLGVQYCDDCVGELTYQGLSWYEMTNGYRERNWMTRSHYFSAVDEALKELEQYFVVEETHEQESGIVESGV